MFRDPTNPARQITHRVEAISADGVLTSKGDASSSADQAPVPLANVRGKYRFSVPEAGRFVHWMGTREGYVAIILGPGLMIVGLELMSIGRTLGNARKTAAPAPE